MGGGHARQSVDDEAEPRASRQLPNERKRLVKVDNGLRFFEQMPGPGEPPFNVPILEAMGRVYAPPEAVFKLLMELGRSRREWDITFAHGCVCVPSRLLPRAAALRLLTEKPAACSTFTTSSSLAASAQPRSTARCHRASSKMGVACSRRRVIETVNGHTDIIHLQYRRLPIWGCGPQPYARDLCCSRYWRRDSDGSYIILLRSRVHPQCPPRPGCVPPN